MHQFAQLSAPSVEQVSPFAVQDEALPIRYLSLFSGIGGFERGLERAFAPHPQCNAFHAENDNDPAANDNTPSINLEASKQAAPTCVGFSEIDKHAVHIYRRHFPMHQNYGDITQIDARCLPDFDLLVAGFPCQAFSLAGKRRGFADTRGTLFFDIARIAREKRPRLLLLENVKGLLSHDTGRTFLTILTTLDELGYDCGWQVLNSKDFGVPQSRERMFIVGHLRGTPRPEIFPLFGAAGKAIAQLNRPRHSKSRAYDVRTVPPTLNTMQGGRRQPFIRVREATRKGYAEATVGQAINLSRPNCKNRRGRVGDIAHTLDTGMQQYTLTSDGRLRRLTPTECERLQGFPDGWTAGLSDTQRYRALGNAVTVPVITAIAERLFLKHQEYDHALHS